MRRIDLIVVHCSASRCDKPYPVTALIRDHRDRFGFTGYHYYITRDGAVYQTRHEQLIGAHAKGYNKHSLGVCYEGGLTPEGTSADTRTPKQKRALLTLLRRLKKEHPQARIPLRGAGGSAADLGADRVKRGVAWCGWMEAQRGLVRMGGN